MSPNRSLLAIIGAVVALLISVGTASATTLTVTVVGPTSFSAPATTGVNITLHTVGRTVSCSSGSASISVPSSATGTAPLAFGRLTPVLPASGGSCRITGGLAVNISCNPGVPEILSPTIGDVTPLFLTNLDCDISLALNPACMLHLHGSASASFNNRTHQMTIFAAGQSLVATGSTCATLPNDSNGTLSNTTSGDLVLQAPSTFEIHAR